MRKPLVAIGLLSLAVLLLSSCTNQSQPPKQTTIPKPTATIPAQHFTLLKPEVAVPAGCPITPVYTGSLGKPDLDVLPWMKAAPVSSNIIAYLFFAGPVSSNTQTYRLLHTGGGYPDGRSTKILWNIQNVNSGNDIQITGKKLSGGQDTFQQTFPVASSPLDDYPSIVNVPSPGCWQLTLKSGTVTGTAVFWVVDN